MPSNKEILEAQRYNRRRLITAFSSANWSPNHRSFP